jgi:hypothetical protein
MLAAGEHCALFERKLGSRYQRVRREAERALDALGPSPPRT